MQIYFLKHFIPANKETAKELMLMKARRQKMKHSDDERIKQARSDIQGAYVTNTGNPTEEKHENLNEKKMVLKEVHDTIFGEEMNYKVTQIERASSTNKHQENWKIINDKTGRKTTKRGILKGSSKEGRVKNWFNYFK